MLQKRVCARVMHATDVPIHSCDAPEMRLRKGEASAEQAKWALQPKHTDRSRLIVRRFVEAYRVSWTFLAQVRETGTLVAYHFHNVFAWLPYYMHISCQF